MEERKILLKIELDVDQLAKNAKTAEAELAKIIPKMTELKKAGQQNTIEYKTLVVEQQKYNKQLTDSVKAIQANKTANESQTGSLREMRDVLAAAKVEFQNLTQEQRDSEGGKEMARQMNVLKTAINEVEASFGTYTGEVGKYEEAVSNALAEQARLSRSFKEVAGSTDSLENKFNDLNEKVTKTPLTIRDLSQAVQAYTSVALQAEEGSVIRQEALDRAGELKDRLGDLRQEVDNLANDQKNLQGLLEIGSGVTAGYGAFQGMMALAGEENEAFTETLIKLQAAQTVMSSLQQISIVLQKESAAATFLNTARTKAQTVAQLVYNTAIGNSTGLMKGFKTALLATGIGALVVGVGLLVANFDKLKAAFAGTSDEQDALNETMDAYKSGAVDAIKETSKVKVAFDLAKTGVISKKEALKTYNETLGDSFGKAKNLNEAEKLYVDKTDAYIKATGLRAQANALLEKAADEQVAALTADFEKNAGIWDQVVGQFTHFSLDIVKMTNDIEKDVDNSIKKTGNQRATAFTKLAEDLLSQAHKLEDANEITMDSDEKNLDAWKKLQEEKARLAKQIADRIIELQLSTVDLASSNQRKVIEAYYAFLETEAKDNADELIRISEEKNQELAILDQKDLDENKRRITEKYDSEALAAKDNATLVASLTEQKNLELSSIQIDFNNKVVERAKAVIDRQNQLNEERVKNERDALNRIATLDAELALERAKGTDGELDAWKNLQNAKIAQLEKSQAEQLAVIALSEAERKAIITETEIAIQQIKNETFEADQQLNEQQKASTKDMVASALSSAQALSDSLFQIKQNQYTKELNELTAKTDAESTLLQQQLDAGLISQAEYNTKKSALDSQANAKAADIKKKQFKADRAAALIQAAINTAVGITAASPNVPLMIVAGALGALQAGIIAGQPEPKFAKGGVKSGTFGGKAHSSGGTKGVFSDGTKIEVEKDENFYIINKRSSDLINRLSHLNQMGGGVPLAKHGAVMKFQGGGTFAQAQSQGVSDRFAQQNDLMKAFASLPRPVVLVEDINGAQGQLAEVEQRASF